MMMQTIWKGASGKLAALIAKAKVEVVLSLVVVGRFIELTGNLNNA